MYWFDGAVLKSDSVLRDRPPDPGKALHLTVRAHRGPYRAILNDPGRAVAISLDGKSWTRFDGGSEAALGVVDLPDGVLDLWVDACYRDPISAGPAYLHYVRLIPTEGAASVDRHYGAALQRTPTLERGSVEEKRVDVRVRGAQFAHGNNWPAGAGIPIPQGELAAAERVAVLDAQGLRVPSQSRAMATWPDGSVKWLYVDFFHDFSKASEGGYSVAYGNRVQPAPPEMGVRVSETSAGLEVNTGAMRFLVPRSRFGMVEQVRLASGKLVQREPIAAEIVEADGKPWRAVDLPVEKLEVEQAGPLHTVILAQTRQAPSGQPASGFVHRARIHAFAGSPLIRIDYFVANTDSRLLALANHAGLSKLDVKSIALKLRPADPITGALNASGPAPSAGALVQTSARAGLPGWVGVQTGAGVLYAGIEAFSEQYPKALRWKPGEIEMALWAEEGGSFEWIEGVGKTHHISLLYGAPALAGGALPAQGRVLALAAPEWYAASGAFGDLTPAHGSGLPAVEKTIADHMRGPVIDGVGLGFENYGDHSSSGYVKGTYLWDNNEYDLPAAAILHFARTGDRDALRLGLASALHYLDVDTIHYSSRNAGWARAQRVHSHGATGHHTAQGPDMHHAGYVQGLLWYSYFTGEAAGVEGAAGIADWVLRTMRPENTAGNMERALGHPLMTLNDVYEATWDTKYLKGAAQLVDWAMKWEHPVRSGFAVPVTESPAYYSGSPFCGGLLSTALIQFNQWARLAAIDAMLERVARWTLTDVWRPPDSLVLKGGSPRESKDPRHIANQLPLMSYVFARTGDPAFLAVPLAAVTAGFAGDPRPIGTRSTGIMLNYLPSFLATLQQRGNPRPDAELEVRGPGALQGVRGGRTLMCFTVANRGASEVRRLRESLLVRVDFEVLRPAQAPESLAAGQEVQLCYDVRIPTHLNLTSDYNRIAYSHWSALYERNGQPFLAKTWTELRVER
jgi:hypothetical protein